MKSPSLPASLVVGCGFLGWKILQRLVDSGGPVWASTRDVEKAKLIKDAGAVHLTLDLDQPATWSGLDALDGRDCRVYFLVPPSKIKLDLLRQVLQQLAGIGPRRLVLCSSTVVFGKTTRIVNADSSVDIDSQRAARQFEIEKAFCETRLDTRIVRLAGLYGEDRIVGRQSVLAGDTLRGSAQSYLNLVHVGDAADLLIRVMHSESAGLHELGSDGTPILRGDYYRLLARQLSAPEPVFAEDEAGGEGRRCDNTLTCERNAWKPRHPDCRELLKAL